MFDFGVAHAVVQMTCDREPDRLPMVDKYRGDVETIVTKAQQKDPAHRYTTAAGTARVWEVDAQEFR